MAQRLTAPILLRSPLGELYRLLFEVRQGNQRELTASA